MNTKAIVAGTAVALALAAAGSPASAVITTFATYSAIGVDNFYYKNPGDTVSPATFFTYTPPVSPSPTFVPAPGSAVVKFSFINEGLALEAAVTGVNAKFTLSGVSDGPVVLNPFTDNLEQFLDGSFSYVSTAPITVGAHTYAIGSNLLSGTFGRGVISGQDAAGGIAGTNAGGLNARALVLTSDFLTFSPGRESFTYTLNAAIPGIENALAGTNALASFKADAGGSFAASPVPVSNDLPEPASWALMMVGFGFAGASIRRRARVEMAV